jgi:polyhydroxyalkanoate synthesis repressor PhaR
MTLMTQPTRHVIKKYANRKLYDTRTSRYVTLQGISELVRAGHDVQVIERDSGRDLTPLVLSQIVTSEEKRTGTDNGTTTPQERGQTLIGYVRRTLSVPAALVSGEVERRRSDLEDLVEVAVARALQRLSIPNQRDLDLLRRRLDALERDVRELRRQQAGPPPGAASGAAPAP